MLIRPQQALPLVRNHRTLLIINYILKYKVYKYDYLSNIRDKMFNPFSRTSCLTSYTWSKLALLHRVKDRKLLSLSDYASGSTLFPEGGVVWKIPYYHCPAPIQVPASSGVFSQPYVYSSNLISRPFPPLEQPGSGGCISVWPRPGPPGLTPVCQPVLHRG